MDNDSSDKQVYQLPKLPEGQRWFVGEVTDPFDHRKFYGGYYVELQELRDTTETTGWGFFKDVNTKKVWTAVEYAMIRDDDGTVSYDITPELIQNAALFVLDTVSSAKRVNALLGAYPPKRLEDMQTA